MGELTKAEKRKVRKPLLWVGMASIAMTFAGLTSGYVVSRSALLVDNRWLQFALPTEFYLATAAIVLSSLGVIWARSAAKKDDQKQLLLALWLSLGMGLIFVLLQYLGWNDLVERGLFFTGPKSNTAISWVYIITFLHWLHVISGLIVLGVTVNQARKGKYTSADHQGLDLSAIYWHFLDGLWIYLFLFLAFIR